MSWMWILSLPFTAKNKQSINNRFTLFTSRGLIWKWKMRMWKRAEIPTLLCSLLTVTTKAFCYFAMFYFVTTLMLLIFECHVVAEGPLHQSFHRMSLYGGGWWWNKLGIGSDATLGFFQPVSFYESIRITNITQRPALISPFICLNMKLLEFSC